MLLGEEIAWVGFPGEFFDDFQIAQISFPPLTTIRQPLEEMADAAYKMAAVHANDILNAPQRTTFEPELIVRKSA